MPLGFGRPKEEDVISLIAAREYGRAIEILRAQLKKRGASNTLRKQLADVLLLSGKTTEAVALLLPLADQLASEGFAAKAVAVLKKIQKVDPGRRDVEERLARLIQERQRQAIVLPLSRPAPEIGIEEIGIEPSASPVALPSTPPAPVVTPPEPGPPAEGGPSSPPAPQQPATSEPAPVLAPPPEPGPVLIPPEAAASPSSAPSPPPQNRGPDAAAGEPEEIEDYDLLYEDDEEDADVEEVTIDVEAAAEPAIMTDGAFADELMSLVDSVFQESPTPTTEERGQEAEAASASSGGSQIVVSPLFRDFAVDEMVAVIQGLKLLTHERGEVILREGQPGASLYTLTSGRVRAFRKDPATGKQVRIGDLKEGAFFGEMSILTGQPRVASVVALTRCELLELDRATLDEITQRHPHVWDVLREFAEKRSQARG